MREKFALSFVTLALTPPQDRSDPKQCSFHLLNSVTSPIKPGQGFLWHVILRLFPLISCLKYKKEELQSLYNSTILSLSGVWFSIFHIKLKGG